MYKINVSLSMKNMSRILIAGTELKKKDQASSSKQDALNKACL